MLIAMRDADGGFPNAKIEIEAGAIILHSRGGARGEANERNTDYQSALRIILTRLQAAGRTCSVWLDSSVAQQWLKPERLLVEALDFRLPIDDLILLIGRRGAAKGRSTPGGNTTKRIRIEVPDMSEVDLLRLLGAHIPPGADGASLPPEVLRWVEPEMIDEAIETYKSGAEHKFGPSTGYDILLPSGERLPPKAVFGLALERGIGRPATPDDFYAGRGNPCFQIIEDAGYPIVAKEDASSFADPEIDDEDSWTEGHSKLRQHRRRERKPGRARLKKRRFIEEHGHLFCERCGLVPTPELGPFGDACIEVHHTVPVAEMDGERPIRLCDLKCLCANCHRIVHRELAAAVDEAAK